MNKWDDFDHEALIAGLNLALRECERICDLFLEALEKLPGIIDEMNTKIKIDLPLYEGNFSRDFLEKEERMK